MRLVKLSVQRFQCIESADVEFGPGLNVLYGPNDLGKSSLAWAIRAVLLLQHNSSHHERFVSWYGDGEPRVSLTFTDADERYWKVTKTFGGSAGRSVLETSKDGLTFTGDTNGRQVDEKLRKLLGWGIQAPGGAGAGRGFPDSFLAQVLLSEQDSVRKVLFDTSLTKDADESGRRRLTEALGALAQDPMFKAVLDDAQGNVDRAFTATGRKKKSAGSPFIEVAARIKIMQEERDELEAKVRETAAAEARIRELIELRDVTARELAESRATLAEHQASLLVAKRRRVLEQKIGEHKATLQTGDGLRRDMEWAQVAVEDLERQIVAGAPRVQELTATAAQHAAARDVARQKLDLITHEDGAADRQQADVREQQRTAQEQLHDSERALERATEEKRAAKTAAEGVTAATAAISPLATTSQAADAALAAATDNEARALKSLEDAKQRLRDATSGDKAQARELRRTELENRRLTRAADRTRVVALQRQVADAKEAAVRATTGQAACVSLAHELAAARAAVSSSEKAVETLGTSLEATQRMLAVGRLRAARAEVAAASEASARASRERTQAASLRAEESSLRATVRDNLPPSTHVAELRRLAEDLRVAEASLGGGMSITIRPRRELTITATVDGASAVPRTTHDPVSLSASRAIAIAIDDLVDVEITAGEEAVRTRAATLRARWAAEGASLLRVQGVESIEALEALLAEAEVTRRAADDRRRDAEAADHRAMQSSINIDLDALAARVVELEQSLGSADVVALGSSLDKFGTTWDAALQKLAASTTADRGTLVAKLDGQRQQVTRSEARLESEMPAAAALQEEATRRQAELGDALPELEARTQAELDGVDRDLTDIEQQLVMLSGGATEDAAARVEVEAAEKAVGAAVDERKRRGVASQHARDALAKAEARRDLARTQARELDRDGVWTTALDTGATLELTRWIDLRDQAELRRDGLKQTCTALQQKLDDLVRVRNLAIQAARDAAKLADDAAVKSQASVTELTDKQQRLQNDVNTQRLGVANLKTQLAGAHLELARTAIAELQNELDALGADTDIDEGDVDLQELHTNRLDKRLRETEYDLSRARGALEQVGGAIVRERQLELTKAIERETRREHEIEVEYDAWKLLVDTLRETESTEGAHLGRALAVPVSKRFRELTGGLYGSFELGAHLEDAALQVAGEVRDISALSAGTQDQLATLLRLCVAEQLRTGIVLDDHLSQSDPARVSWFNSMLRTAAHQIQIVFITCRPLEVLTESEMPAVAEDMKASAAGQLRAIDMTKVIRRFAAGAGVPQPGSAMRQDNVPAARQRGPSHE
ncbi:hypothetical protein BH11MYX2_BH11MYX2_12030 [soil metagenome]